MTARPPLPDGTVTRSEAAQIPGVTETRVSRFRNAGRLQNAAGRLDGDPGVTRSRPWRLRVLPGARPVSSSANVDRPNRRHDHCLTYRPTRQRTSRSSCLPRSGQATTLARSSTPRARRRYSGSRRSTSVGWRLTVGCRGYPRALRSAAEAGVSAAQSEVIAAARTAPLRRP